MIKKCYTKIKMNHSKTLDFISIKSKLFYKSYKSK